MLNSSYIHSKIIAPEACVSEDSLNFKELMELYPYASSFSLLYIKSLANSGDVRLESELEKISFQINDRSILHRLIHSKKVLNSESEIITEPIEDILEIEKEGTENKIASIETPTNDSDSQTDINSTKIEEVPKSTILTVENRTEDLLDKLITAAAISSTFVEQEIESLPELVKEETFVPQNSSENKSEDLEKDEKSVGASEQENNSISSPKSFTSWLKSSANFETEHSEENEDEKKNPEYYTFEKPKKEFFSPTKKAKESLDENKMPVSETLAKIFALQGNFSKAIYVYEQLILIFPEKKTFFATQIKNLKKKINS